MSRWILAALVFPIGCGPVVEGAEESSTEAGSSSSSGSATGLEPTTSSTTAQTDPSTTATATATAATSTDSSATGSTSTSTSTSSSGSTDASSSSSGDQACASPYVDEDDRLEIAGAPMRGTPDGLITIVQWSSPRCSFCRTAKATIDTLRAGALGSEIRIIAKQYPAPIGGDPAAISAMARSELAAGELGAFWEFHDAIYAAAENEDVRDPAVLDQLALDVGLDLEAFHAARDSDAVRDQLDADIALSEALGNQAVPFFIINGESVLGAQPLTEFESISMNQQIEIEALLDEGASLCEAFGERLDQQLPQ